MATAFTQVIVGNTLEELPQIYQALEGFCSSFAVPDYTRRSILLISEELFSNTVMYGYPDEGSDEIALDISLAEGEISLVFRNHAIEFDSAASPDGPDQENAIEDHRIGGLGLFLVHQLAKKVESRRQGLANITTVTVDLNADDE